MMLPIAYNSPIHAINNTLLIAVLMAFFIHLALIWGIHFSKTQPDKITKSLDITLVTTPDQKAPENATLIANENSQSAIKNIPKPQPAKQAMAKAQPKQSKATKKIQENIPVKPVEKKTPDATKPQIEKKYITQKDAEKMLTKVVKFKSLSQPQKRAQITAESVHQQIAQLGTTISQKAISSEQQKIKFVSDVSSHKYLAAQYMKDWESKVERLGNLNYPEEAKKNAATILTMDVGIKVDGGIYSIRITKSSGNPALDKAAIKIVRMGAPYAPLPLELRNELEVLVITRAWKFTDESSLITK